MNFVDLDRVSLRYGEDADGTLALHRATLQVGNGEFVAVVGPSGCGKSTLMKVVTGLWPPTAGAVVVSGREVTAPLNIAGMAFQNPTLLPWRTTLANVMLPLEIVEPHCSRLKRERAAYLAKARDLLALVGLKGFEDRFPWQLSGGMQQRASLCRALIHDPSLLMLDEPFASLDMFTREELWLALQDLVARASADRHPRHPRPARSRIPGRPGAGDERKTRPHHCGARGRSAAAAQARHHL